MKERLGTGGVVVIALVLVGLAFLALRATRTEVQVTDTPQIEHPADGSAVVARLTASGGMAPFGWQVVDPTHRVELQFLTGAGCAERLESGDPWPTSIPECSSDVEVIGKVAAVGRTGTGQSLVGVEFEVSRPCFEALQLQVTWPPIPAECA